MKSLCLKILKLRVLIPSDDVPPHSTPSDDDDGDDDISTGSVVVHDVNEEQQYHINCALILWDMNHMIKLLLLYNIRIYHRESHFERVSYYTITILYQSFLILFDGDPFCGDIIDRFMALILNSITGDAMKLSHATKHEDADHESACSLSRTSLDASPQCPHRNGNGSGRSNAKGRRRSVDWQHPAGSLDIDYFMPSILTITGDPGIVLCDFWFGGAFPSKTDRNVSGDALGEQEHGDDDPHGDRHGESKSYRRRHCQRAID